MPSLPRRSASSGAADVPAARLNYRYAGLERFSGRPRVYENPPADAPPPLPERQAPLTPPSSLSFKREMFFRESPVASSTVGVPTTVAAATLGAGLASPSAPKEEGTSPYATSGRSQAEGCVGFASLPNQVYRKAVKKGFEFTLMVVGKVDGSCSAETHRKGDIAVPRILQTLTNAAWTARNFARRHL